MKINYSLGNFIGEIKIDDKEIFADLYEKYLKYCTDKNYESIGKKTFAIQLRESGLEVYKSGSVMKIRKTRDFYKKELVKEIMKENNKIDNKNKDTDKIVDKLFGTLTNKVKTDNVNKPNHYMIGNTGLECKDFIAAWIGKENYSIFCYCNIMKYLTRAEKKNKLEDYKKAIKYLEMIIDGGANRIVLDISDLGIEDGTKSYAGIEWNDIITSISENLPAKLALKLDSVFRSLAQEDYENCKNRLLDFISCYENNEEQKIGGLNYEK